MGYRKRKGRWVFYYDGNCGFCRAAAGFLRPLDLFRRLTWMPFQTLDAPPPGLSWADLDRAVYLETGKQRQVGRNTVRLYEGFYAFRLLTLRLPPLLPLAPFLWLPGANRLGVAVYRWVARNRYCIGQCAAKSAWPPTGGRHSRRHSLDR